MNRDSDVIVSHENVTVVVGVSSHKTRIFVVSVKAFAHDGRALDLRLTAGQYDYRSDIETAVRTAIDEWMEREQKQSRT